MLELQKWTIGEFLRAELVVKRGLRIFSGLTEQECDDLPFQPVRPIISFAMVTLLPRFGCQGILL